MMKKNSSIYEVAKLAKVSHMTVTRTFNGDAKVSDKTREKVLAAAKELDFLPNLLAKNLKRGSSQSVGVLWSMCHPYFVGNEASTISNRFLSEGYSCYFVDSRSDIKIVERCLLEFAGNKFDSVIINHKHFQEQYIKIIPLLNRFKAVLLVGNEYIIDSQFDQIVFNVKVAIAELFNHYKSQGRKKIAVFNMRKEQEMIFQELSQEFGIEVLAINIPDDKQFLRSCEAEYVRQFSKNDIPFDCVLSFVDETASMLIKSLIEMGVKVPEDIAVCGYNNSILSQYFHPSISSIDRGDSKLGSLMADIVLSRLKNPDTPLKTEWINYKFISRKSTQKE